MKISVVIPTFNRQNSIKRAIDSVLAQSFLASEIIIVDDGSTDNTLELLKEYSEIKVISQPNRGVSSARNTGIKACSNEWIAFLDSDDQWHKNKLLQQSTFHKENPDYKFSYTNEKWIRCNKEIKIPKRHKKQTYPTFSSSLEHCQIGPSTVMLHASVFENVGYFDEDMEVCEDYDLWLRILKKYKTALIKEALTIKYAGAKNQLSMKYWALDRWHVKSLFKHADDELVCEVIKNKCDGLQKAALKYGDEVLFSECKEWIEQLQE